VVVEEVEQDEEEEVREAVYTTQAALGDRYSCRQMLLHL
jgi:hypothetical protein